MTQKYDFLSIDDVLNQERKDIVNNYKQHVNPGLATLMTLMDFDKIYVKARGTRVWDKEGNCYLDFLGGYGSLNLGHNHPAVIEAVESVREMPNLLQAAISPLAGALARNLALFTEAGLNNTFFCNSGAEAVEGALKLARIVTGRTKIVTTEGSFHGKTMGALSVTGRTKYQQWFKPLLAGIVTVPYGDAGALEETLAAGDCAAFIVEPVQGEGGIIIPPAGYLAKARERCSAYGTMLIIDEIQTGFGRTGRNFAYQEEGVKPDILCLAKSLGGGIMPVGAFMTTEKLWKKAYGSLDKCLLHTSTFGGNARAMAAGIKTLEIIVKEDLAAKAAEKGAYLLNRLKDLQQKYRLIKAVRGKGLLIGVEFESGGGLMNTLSGGMLNKFSQEYMGALVAGELLNRYRIITAYTLNNPNVIRLEPPLTVSYEELDTVIDGLEKIFSEQKSIAGFAAKAGKTVLSSLFKK
ncbi:MAG TPA: aspartate aminotransferase family protein [Firmicutes bacterium]|nr:aspartate aminotransferase family protein [Bacillota bacterium]